MQFDRDDDGAHDAAAAAFDRHRHGARARRRVLQGKLSNYDTDLIRPIIERAGELMRRSVRRRTTEIDMALRINADHARATAFLIHDGVLPSNEGRGYVLRKIMRRAMRNARMAACRIHIFTS